jgi:hypothetical protein
VARAIAGLATRIFLEEIFARELADMDLRRRFKSNS